MKKRSFIVMTDSNDADYITDVVTVDDATVEKFMPIIEAIRDFNKSDEHKLSNQTRNWSDMTPFTGRGKTCSEVYPQFTEEYLNEFFEEFLIGTTPNWLNGEDVCGPKMIDSFHTIALIQEIELKDKLIDTVR